MTEMTTDTTDMKMAEYPKLILDTWSWMEAIRRLGFTASQLYVIFAPNGASPVPDDDGMWVFVRLEHLGKDVTIEVGSLAAHGFTVDTFSAKWIEFGDAYNDRRYNPEDAKAAYLDGPLFRMPNGAARFMQLLANKGIEVPRNKQ